MVSHQIKRMVDLDEIYQALKPSMAGDDVVVMRDVAREVAWAYQVTLDDGSKTYWILRPEGTVLVMMCVNGVKLKEALTIWYPAVIKAGFTSVRFHTQRPALARMLKDWGPTLTEYVFRVDLDGRQQQ